jgi:hypothetical protein
MPIPQRNARPRPAFYGNSLPSSGSVSPASASSSLAKAGIQGISTRHSVKPGYLVPRKTTLHFAAATRVDERQTMDTEILEAEVVHPDADEADQIEYTVKERRPMGLGELIAANRGNSKPPRGM